MTPTDTPTTFHILLSPTRSASYSYVRPYIFAADLSAAQRRSILGHKNFHDSDWSANNPQPSSDPIGESCTLLGDMLLIYTIKCHLGKKKKKKKGV